MDPSSLRIGITTHPDPDLTSPYFSDCLAGLLTVFPHPSLIVNPHDLAVDGWILLAPDPAHVDVVRKNGRPAVIVNGEAEGVPSIDLDNVGAARDVTLHLADQGHRRIGFIAGKMETSNGRDRLEGYQQGLRLAGIPWDSGLVVEGRFSREEGKRKMGDLLKSPSPPTAVFAANDHMALGAWDCLKERNIRVPETIALAGFDDIPEAESRGLTSVRQPLMAMAGQAGVWLRDWMQTGRRPDVEFQSFSGDPILRISSGSFVDKNPL